MVPGALPGTLHMTQGHDTLTTVVPGALSVSVTLHMIQEQESVVVSIALAVSSLPGPSVCFPSVTSSSLFLQA